MPNRQLAAWQMKDYSSLRMLKNGTLDGSFKGTIHLNRSRKWMPAKNYQHAREISPSSRPVR